MALVLETSEFSGGYVLGFKVDKLEEVYTEVNNLFKTYSISPVFGVEVTFDDVEQNLDAVTVPRVEDNLEIIDTGYDSMAIVSTKSSYSMGGGSKIAGGEQPDIVLSDEIGLAIERLPPGTTLESLWKIV
jgi:Bardet-Biedl syndrome 5 protein